mmetsp:Transcript_1527/g.1810  ORF Transcript_1527/g.1810 Transcript_1527/m.1810 type:complete len:99 (-) Transcript_1527:1387-1683(-)
MAFVQTLGLMIGLVVVAEPNLNPDGINWVEKNLEPPLNVPTIFGLAQTVSLPPLLCNLELRLKKSPITMDESVKQCVEHNSVQDILSGCHCDRCDDTH